MSSGPPVQSFKFRFSTYLQSVKGKKARSSVQRAEVHAQGAAVSAARAEILLPDSAGYLEAEGIERTHKFRQSDIRDAVDVSAARQVFDLSLPEHAPYHISYTRNGRYLALGGAGGHLAIVDSLRRQLVSELHTDEAVHDISFLHNMTLFAAAQHKYVYIYDHTGVEIHVMRQCEAPRAIDFLPHHFLLTSIGEKGILKYHDVTTGVHVAAHRTKLGACRVLKQNPWNAVVGAGHGNGCVTLWSPNVNEPLAKMVTGPGPVSALAFSADGQSMVTGCVDGKVRVWDLRMYKELHAYRCPVTPSSVDLSHRGMLAVGSGSHVTVWADAIATKATSPYMSHRMPGQSASDVLFRPLEDVLGVGHSAGFSSLLVPGAGEANVDSLAANPFQTKRARQESEVVALMDKLPPSMIALDPSAAARVDTASEQMKAKEVADDGAAAAAAAAPVKRKKKTRGRSKASRVAAKKSANVLTVRMDQRRMEVAASKEKQARQEDAEAARGQAGGGAAGAAAAGGVRSALSRFFS